MIHKVAGTIATLMALFFLVATLKLADEGFSGAAILGTMAFAILVAVACFSFALSTKPTQAVR